MHCEQALTLISADLDHEIQPPDRPWLDDHLKECAGCSATAEAFRLQDGDLRRTFAPRREAVMAVAERVMERIALLEDDVAPRRVLPLTEDVRLRRVRRVMSCVMAAAASVAGVALCLHALEVKPGRPIEIVKVAPRPETIVVPAQPKLESVAMGEMTALRRSAGPAVALLAVGDTVRTQVGERRRLALADGSTVSFNENTTACLDAPRHVSLTRGEMIAEVAKSEQTGPDTAFVVQTPDREVKALGTKFAVRAKEPGTDVVVTQGRVQVSGCEHPVAAGQQLSALAKDATPAPRASYLFDWSKDLVAAAETPLVPESRYRGGALVATDSSGQPSRLALPDYKVDVHIEDGFARTTIDQTYFNHDSARREGTFYFPLPPDASLSRLAMYVNGQLMEGGMTDRDQARDAFETIVHQQKDPALLEWVDGSTFKMRVFPLEPQQKKRIILSYTQRLPSLYGRTQYRFPSGHSLEQVGAWSFHAHVKGGANLDWSSEQHTLKPTKDGTDLMLDEHADNVKIERDVALRFQDRAGDVQEGEAVRCASDVSEDSRYFMVRYQPNLPGEAERQRRDWVFLFESSGDRDPLLARVQVDVIRTLLTNAEHDDTFVVLTAGTRVHSFDSKPRPATAENVQAAVRFLEQSHLIGALDLGQALDAVQPYLKTDGNPCLVHVGSGIPALGERSESVLAKRIPSHAHYVGVGVGKRWARGFMKTAAERSDGYFTQINPDEPVAWRAFDLFATLNTPRLLNVQVVDNAEQARFLTYAGSLAQGEELCAVARLDAGARLPEAVTVSGTLHGQPYHRVLPVRNVSDQAGYLPRTWARLEIDRLLAEDAAGNKPKIVELSIARHVMTPFTSLLVLENPGMYKQLGVDPGINDRWAPYACPERLAEVLTKDAAKHLRDNEPDSSLKRRGTAEVRQSLVDRAPPPLVQWPNYQADYARQTVNGLEAYSPTALGLNRADGYANIQPNTAAGGGPAAGPELAFRPGSSHNYSLQSPRSATATPSSAGGLLPAGPLLRARQTLQTTRGLKEADGLVPPVVKADNGPAKKPAAAPGGAMPAPVTAPPADTPAAPLPSAGAFAAPADKSASTPMPAEGVEKAWGAMPSREGGARALGRTDPAPRSESPESLLQSVEAQTESKGGGRFIDGLRRGQQEEALSAQRILSLQEREELERATFADATGGDRAGRRKELAPLSRLYRRPVLSLDERLFSDLLAYAPGLRNSAADVQAVLEVEAAADTPASTGLIDPAARRLIDRARAAGWQEVTVPKPNGNPALTLHCDGAGRHRYEHTLGTGLREQVICDGRALWSLYPDLDVGAERTVSRFHRAEFADLVPWFVPPAEDLAQGADLRCTGDRTIAVIPRGAESAIDSDGKPLAYARTEFLFAADGNLAERRVLRMPGAKVLSRETYAADGVVRRLGAEGQVLAEHRFMRRPAQAPSLSPEAGKLVVLPLPLRSREHLQEAYGENLPKGYKQLRPDIREAVLASAYALHNPSEAVQVFRSTETNRKHPLGYYTILAACGVQVQNKGNGVDVLADYPDEPLARYLAFHTNPQRKQGDTELGDIAGPPDGFVQRLSAFHDLSRRWHNGIPGSSEAERRQERTRVLAFIQRNTGSSLGWALLSQTLDHLTADEAFRQAVTEVCRRAEPHSDLAYAVCYEHARNLLNQGHRAEAQELFRNLYAGTLEAGSLPPIDASFRQSFQADAGVGARSQTGPSAWSDFVRQTAASLTAKRQRPAVVALAWQCRELGDQERADDLVARASQDPTVEERLPAGLAGVEYWSHTGQPARAEALLQSLLNDEHTAQDASLWRLGATLAARRGEGTLGVSYLEKALDREYVHPPEGATLEAVRHDYATLLSHYQSLAEATVALKQAPPRDFAARVIRAADRWRSLDPDPTAACQAAARVLKTLGLHDVAWDYLTTPIGLHPGEAAAWLQLARTLQQQGDLDLTDRAYAQAVGAEPTNAQILWDRALNLQQTGKTEEARQLFRKLADGPWQPRFAKLQVRARKYLSAP